MSIYDFNKKSHRNTEIFEKAKKFQIGQVDKSGKHVKTAQGWVPIKKQTTTDKDGIHSLEHGGSKHYSKSGESVKDFHDRIAKENYGGNTSGSALNDTDKATIAILKIGQSGKMPTDEMIKRLAEEHGMTEDKFKEAVETSINAYKNEKDEKETPTTPGSYKELEMHSVKLKVGESYNGHKILSIHEGKLYPLVTYELGDDKKTPYTTSASWFVQNIAKKPTILIDEMSKLFSSGGKQGRGMV